MAGTVLGYREPTFPLHPSSDLRELSPVCFSAQADLVAGVVIGAVGVDTLRHVRRRTELPLAALPVVLAAHQLIEVIVWREPDVPHSVWRTAVWLYLVIAFGVVPILVPVAVGALEPVANRRRVAVFTIIATVVAGMLLWAVVRGPIVATVEAHQINYRVELWQGGVLVALYLLATSGSLLMSSLRYVRIFGAVNFAAAAVLAWLNQSGFISLWCVWAAVTSLGIAIHLRREVGDPQSRARSSTFEAGRPG